MIPSTKFRIRRGGRRKNPRLILGCAEAGGRMVTIAADNEATTDQRVKEAFFIVEPDQK